jgi:hypothetical protein
MPGRIRSEGAAGTEDVLKGGIAIKLPLPPGCGRLSDVGDTGTSTDFDSDATAEITSIGDAISGDSDSDADLAPAAAAASRESSTGPSWGSDSDDSCDDPFSELCPLENVPPALDSALVGREDGRASAHLRLHRNQEIL